MVLVSLSAALAAALISAGLIRVIIVVAHRLRLFEKTDHRRTHTGSIPFLGGVGIALSFLVTAAGGGAGYKPGGPAAVPPSAVCRSRCRYRAC